MSLTHELHEISICGHPAVFDPSNPASLLRQKFLEKKDGHLQDKEQQLYLSILPAFRVFSQSLKVAQSLESFQASCPTKKSGQMALQEKLKHFMPMK